MLINTSISTEMCGFSFDLQTSQSLWSVFLLQECLGRTQIFHVLDEVEQLLKACKVKLQLLL